jgi:hypothetical protein
MNSSDIHRRLTILEEKIASLAGLPARLERVELHIVQLRTEMRDGFSALRTELQAEMHAFRDELRAEMRTLHEDTKSDIRLLADHLARVMERIERQL